MSDLADAKRLYKASQFAEADAAARRALATSPDHPDALNVLAMCAMMTRRWDDAMPLLERVVALKPNYARSRANIAFLLFQHRRFPEAEKHAQHAAALMPKMAFAHTLHGRAMAEQGRKDEGLVALLRAIEVEPNHIEALFWIGFIHSDAHRYDRASEYFERLLLIQPDYLDAIYALAFAQRAQGLLDAALQTYERGKSVAPADAQLHSAMLFSLVYRPDLDEPMLHRAMDGWFEQHAAALAMKSYPHAKRRDPQRPVRIGYVSPYFREHAVGFFIEPILEHHDRAKFPISVYSDVEHGDAVTARMRSLACTWRDTAGLTDAALAELIRADGIDVLVDLSQHSGGSRLLAFARKPAPVQVCYLGYPMPTGLRTIDYRLSDSQLDPTVDDDATFERVARLPESYFCYRPPDDSPAPAVDPPCASAGHVTFVSQNALVKLNERCIAAWSRVLLAVPHSKLVIKATGCGSVTARQRYVSLFESHGVASGRIEFRGHTPLREMMRELNEADIALDAFPYNGGTTSCHVLWMGVPVVSLAGKFPVQRMGLSILSQVGLSNLCASDEDEFVRIAVALARDTSRLSVLRRTLRGRMQESPLMDGERFARALEEIYGRMFKVWNES